jgi:protein-tyrosine phosphatase
MVRAAVFTFAALLIWAVLYYAHWVIVRRRLVAIAPGRVYQSGAMSARKLVRYARRYAIATVIDFRGAHEEIVHIEARALAAVGIRHINIPIGTLPADEDIRRFVDVMTDELQHRRRVLMHCKDGQGRAVAFAAIYRIEFEHWTPRSAYQAATRLPPGFKPISIFFPRAGLLSTRNQKTRLILNYQSARPALAAGPAHCTGKREFELASLAAPGEHAEPPYDHVSSATGTSHN